MDVLQTHPNIGSAFEEVKIDAVDARYRRFFECWFFGIMDYWNSGFWVLFHLR